MSKSLLSRALPRTLIAAALMLAVAGPAAAKVVYRWKTDDGVYAFTDDAKRIPPDRQTTSGTHFICGREFLNNPIDANPADTQ